MLKEIRMHAAVIISKPRELVFDFVTRPEAVGELFQGHPPIPGAVKSELMSEGAMGVGAMRRVYNTDGSVVEEEITEFERPSRQAYRIVRGLRPPFSWMVIGGAGKWLLSSVDDGTLIEWTYTFSVRPFTWPIALLLQGYFQLAMKDALDRARGILEGDLQSRQIS